MPSLECTASEPYSSPHKLGSGSPKTLPGPALILSTICLNRFYTCRLCYFIIFLLFLFPFSVFETFACFLVATSYFSFLTRFVTDIKLFFNFIKTCLLIFNYFKFNSNKWQYYFILISVNLLFDFIVKNPEPLTTPSCLINGFAISKSEETRRARRYYYFYYNYNYYYYKHYYTILLWRIAQNSNEIFLNSRKSRASTGIPLPLVINQNREEVIFVKVRNKDEDSSINRIIFHTDLVLVITIRLLLTKDFRMRQGTKMMVTEIAEAIIWIAGLRRGRTKEIGLSMASVIFPSFGSQERYRPFKLRFSIENTDESEQNMNFVIMCCFMRLQCSDPMCEIKTFFKNR